jgi:hypothetical protein
MTKRQPLKPNRELDITAPNDILNLEFRKFRVKPEFLDDARVLSRREPRIVLGFGAGHDHFARGEDEGGGLGVADAHDHGGESLAGSVSEVWERGIECSGGTGEVNM